MSKYKDFTLIEMMIVVAIIAILVSIAIPACTQQVPNGEQQTQPQKYKSV